MTSVCGVAFSSSLKSGSWGPTLLSRTWTWLQRERLRCRPHTCWTNRAARGTRWWPLKTRTTKPPRTSLSCDLHEVSAACAQLISPQWELLNPLNTFTLARIDWLLPWRLQFPIAAKRLHLLWSGRSCCIWEQVLNRAKEMTWEENDYDVPSQCPHD